jgi:hypothetical protein
MSITKDQRAAGGLRRIFAAPALMGLLSLVGLLSALLGDHFWDAVSWATLGIPLLIIAWYIARPATR